MTNKSSYDITKVSTNEVITETDKEVYQEFYRKIKSINYLCNTAEDFIKICAENLCDVAVLLPEMAEALPTEKQRIEARKIIQNTFI